MRRRGFTLVEVLIVVIILAILGTVVSQVYSAAARNAREVALIRNLIGMRGTILTYRSKFKGRYPETVAELEQAIGQLPENPFNGGHAVRIVDNIRTYTIDEDDKIDGIRVGWIYHSRSGSLWANTGGTTSKGRPLAEL